MSTSARPASWMIIVAAATALLAGGTAVARLATSTHQAVSVGYVKVQMQDDAANYYLGVPDAKKPRDATSPDDPTIRRFRGKDPRVVLPVSQQVEAVVWNPTGAGQVLYIINSALPATIAALVALLVLQALRRARSGDPFAPANVRTLSLLGWCLAIGLPLQQLVQAATSIAALGGSYGGPGTMPNGPVASISFASLLPGIAILALARIWRDGARLRDIDLTTV